MPSPRNQHERFVQQIFDRIAGRYDLLNRIISFHLDTIWRKKAVKSLNLAEKKVNILDLGSGTGDLAFTAANGLAAEGRVVGLDFAPKMLQLANAKKKNHTGGDKTLFVLGSALAAPFKNNSFEAVMTGFVLRNVSDLNLFFVEAYRLLKPGGRLATLDMFPPRKGLFYVFYSLYFFRLVPWIGAGLTRHGGAYRYLSESVKGFAGPESIAEVIANAGFKGIRIERFLRGAVCLHIAQKPHKP